MYHRVIIVGHLGGDPVLRYTPAGSPVCNFSVACNRKYRTTTDGGQAEEVVWFRVTCWGSQAERCNEYLSKGRLVLVEGRLTPDKETGHPKTWTGSDGVARSSYELRADVVRFLAGGQRQEDEEEGVPF